MPEKLSKLGVSQESIDATAKHSDPFEDDALSFIKGVLGRIRREQPQLYVYTKLAAKNSGVTDLLAYGLGISLVYDLLPKSHTQNLLTTDQIGAMNSTLIEHLTTEEEDGKQTTAINELAWFISKLEEDSPAFTGWLTASVQAIESMESKKSFILGVIHTSMPFYMREEAREMEQALFRNDKGER